MKIVVPKWLREVIEDAARKVDDLPNHMLDPELQLHRKRKQMRAAAAGGPSTPSPHLGSRR